MSRRFEAVRRGAEREFRAFLREELKGYEEHIEKPTAKIRDLSEMAARYWIAVLEGDEDASKRLRIVRSSQGLTIAALDVSTKRKIRASVNRGLRLGLEIAKLGIKVLA